MQDNYSCSGDHFFAVILVIRLLALAMPSYEPIHATCHGSTVCMPLAMAVQCACHLPWRYSVHATCHGSTVQKIALCNEKF